MSKTVVLFSFTYIQHMIIVAFIIVTLLAFIMFNHLVCSVFLKHISKIRLRLGQRVYWKLTI